jgi:hypothetical protein
VKDHTLFIRSAKTGVQVSIPLPEFVVKSLREAYALKPGKYIFGSTLAK